MSATTHDDFYQRLRARITKWAERNEIKAEYAHYMLALPDLFHLIAKLMLDPRVAVAEKTWLGIALAYVVSPIDVIPDFFGPAAYLDDLLVCALVLDSVLKKVPKGVVAEHWAGSGDVLALIRETLSKADSWSRGLLAKVRAYLERMGLEDKARSVAGKVRDLGREVKEEVEETLAKRRRKTSRKAATASKPGPAPKAKARATKAAPRRRTSTAKGETSSSRPAPPRKPRSGPK